MLVSVFFQQQKATFIQIRSNDQWFKSNAEPVEIFSAADSGIPRVGTNPTGAPTYYLTKIY